MYYNYHAIAKNLIESGELVSYEFVEHYNKISPALVLHFKNHAPMPVREYRWAEYEEILANWKKK